MPIPIPNEHFLTKMATIVSMIFLTPVRFVGFILLIINCLWQHLYGWPAFGHQVLGSDAGKNLFHIINS